MGERFKCCVKCRAREREYSRTYHTNNKDEINERRRADQNKGIYNLRYQQEHREDINEKRRYNREKARNVECEDGYRCCTRCFKTKAVEQFGEYTKQIIESESIKDVIEQCITCKECRNKHHATIKLI